MGLNLARYLDDYEAEAVKWEEQSQTYLRS